MRWPFVSARYADFLQRQLDFWIARTNDERDRAERLNDQLLQLVGREPVSAESRNAAKVSAELTAKAQAANREFWSELMGDEAPVREGEGATPLPESIAEETIALVSDALPAVKAKE